MAYKTRKGVCIHFKKSGECLCKFDEPRECVYWHGLPPSAPVSVCKYYETVKPKTEKFYGFTCESRQDYYIRLKEECKEENETDRIIFGLYYPKGKADVEIMMIWYRLGGETYSRFCIFSDMFKLFRDRKICKLIGELSKLSNLHITSADFSEMLIELGFEDMSDIPLRKGKRSNERAGKKMKQKQTDVTEQHFSDKMYELLPGGNTAGINAIITYARELDKRETESKDRFLKNIFTAFYIVKHKHGQETALLLLDMCKTFTFNHFEIRGAANHLVAGVEPAEIERLALDGMCDVTEEEPILEEEALKVFEESAPL